jgi:hypothetical protein
MGLEPYPHRQINWARADEDLARIHEILLNSDTTFLEMAEASRTALYWMEQYALYAPNEEDRDFARKELPEAWGRQLEMRRNASRFGLRARDF